MEFFDRQYRFSAGRGTSAFEIGTADPTAMHIAFSVEKADTETPNNASVSVWNLNPEHLAILNSKDCIVALRAGYGNHMPLIFTGVVTYTETALDGADRETKIEAADGRIELRDTFVSLSYAGVINTRKIIEDIAAEMGVALTFSYNAEFADIPNGFSCVSAGRGALDKACASSGLQWQIQNGVLQVKNRHDTMDREVFVLSADSGLIGIPKKIHFGADGTVKDSKGSGEEDMPGYEVEYLLNGAIGIGDFVRLESKIVQNYFRVHSVAMDGDNLEGDWKCTAKLIEA
jgi:hypothetical protein